MNGTYHDREGASTGQIAEEATGRGNLADHKERQQDITLHDRTRVDQLCSNDVSEVEKRR
jgi:hypothetical protein